MDKIKFIYVLTSTINDTYYEQFLLSVTSFRLFNPDAQITVLVDSKTKQNLIDKRTAYEKLVSEIQVISPPDDLSQKEASRWIKTSIHHYVSGDFLYIDCDTIITEELLCNFPPDIKVGAVLDTHVTLDRHHLLENFQKEDINTGFSSSLKSNIRYNGGLIFCRDDSTGREFFEKWHSLWLEGRKKGCTQDMPSLNQANYEMGNIITELDGEWNCQISHNGLPYLSGAKIIHYYATSLSSFEPAYALASTDILLSIKKNGAISNEVMELIKNPKAAFMEKSRIIADDVILDIIDSAFFQKLLWLRRNHEKLFFSLNKFISHIKKPWKTNQIQKK